MSSANSRKNVDGFTNFRIEDTEIALIKEVFE